MKKKIIIPVILVIVITLGTAYYFYFSKEQVKTQSQTQETPRTIEEKPKEVPETFLLTVPYTVQAPFANWKVHEESCEEAALLMYRSYVLGRKDDIEPGEADRELRSMKEWQVEKYGREPDLSIEALGKVAEDYYGLKPTIIKNLTKEGIKKEIAEGNPVLVPVMTHSLKNPHYNIEDSYHILLIKGYDETGVITNDAGIKQGKDWKYSWEILWQAIDAQKVTNGRQGLILKK